MYGVVYVLCIVICILEGKAHAREYLRRLQMNCVVYPILALYVQCM